MEKILIFIGIAAVAAVCVVIVRKARSAFSFQPDPDGPAGQRRLPAPDKPTILRRTQCSAVLVRRGFCEIALADGQGDSSVHLDMIERLKKWALARGLHGGFTTEELDLMTAAPGTWDIDAARKAVCGAEALGCLCWALSLLRDVPQYDTPFDVAALISYLHLGEENFDIDRATTLRTFDALLRERQKADLWRWRADLRHRIEQQRKPPRGFAYPQIILMAAKSAAEQGAFAAPIDNDFPACGKALGAISPEEFARVEALIAMRARLLDWLCGYAPTPGRAD